MISVPSAYGRFCGGGGGGGGGDSVAIFKVTVKK